MLRSVDERQVVDGDDPRRSPSWRHYEIRAVHDVNGTGERFCSGPTEMPPPEAEWFRWNPAPPTGPVDAGRQGSRFERSWMASGRRVGNYIDLNSHTLEEFGRQDANACPPRRVENGRGVHCYTQTRRAFAGVHTRPCQIETRVGQLGRPGSSTLLRTPRRLCTQERRPPPRSRGLRVRH